MTGISRRILAVLQANPHLIGIPGIRRELGLHAAEGGHLDGRVWDLDRQYPTERRRAGCETLQENHCARVLDWRFRLTWDSERGRVRTALVLDLWEARPDSPAPNTRLGETRRPLRVTR